ncbi:MAG: DUF4142 domain-containing protein [Bacteroidota bacterium]
MKKTLSIALLLSAMLFQSCGLSDRKDEQETATLDSISDSTAMGKDLPESKNLTEPEMTFINAAAIGGMMEVEAANAVLTLSKDKQVKDFAMLMLKDHGVANKELSAVAAGLGLAVPASLPDEQQMHIRDLKTLADKKLDQQYITMMLGDHAKTIKLFTDGAMLPTPAIKDFASKTLPVIKGHYAKAQALAKALNISNAGNGDDLPGESPADGHTN